MTSTNRTRLSAASFAFAAALFVGATSPALASPDLAATDSVPYSSTRILEIGYRGLNLAPLFWQRAAEVYRIELEPIPTSYSDPSAAVPATMVKHLDLVNLNPPTFNWGEIRPGAYRMRLWRGQGATSVLVEHGPVVVVEAPYITRSKPTNENAQEVAQR